MQKRRWGFQAGPLLCVLMVGVIDAQTGSDPRREDSWQLLRTANLGPKVGNGRFGTNIVVEQKRDRAFIGNLGNISVVDLQLNVVTGVIASFEGSDLAGKRLSLAINERRDELYVRSRNPVIVTVLDLNSLEPVRSISLEAADRYEHISIPEYPRPMLVDEEADRLYVGNASSVSVINLSTGEVFADIDLARPERTLCGIPYPSLIMDLAMDPETRRLYAADLVHGSIEVVDLGNLQIVNSIQLDRNPVQLVRDPAGRYLYVLAREEPEDPCDYFGRTAHLGYSCEALRLDLQTSTVDRRVLLPVPVEQWRCCKSIKELRFDGVFDQNQAPKMVLDSATGKLWVASAPGWHPHHIHSNSISSDLLEGIYLQAEGIFFRAQLFPSRLFAIDVNDFGLDRDELFPSIVQSLQLDPKNEGMLALDVSQGLSRLTREGVVTGVIQVAGDHQAMAVSGTNNRVYITRGGQGGVVALDEEGNVVSTIEGEPTSDILVDDKVDRLFVLESSPLDHLLATFRSDDGDDPNNKESGPRIRQLGVYELSTLRRLDTTPYQASVHISQMRPDYERGVWRSPGGGTFDLLTGAQLTAIPGYSVVSDQLPQGVIDAAADRAYLPITWGDPQMGQDVVATVKIYDLLTDAIVGYIDLLPATGGVPAQVEVFDFDPQRKRLYVWVTLHQEDHRQRMIVVDMAQYQVIDSFDVGGTGLGGGDVSSSIPVVFDPVRQQFYTIRGQIVDLEARDGSRNFSEEPEDPENPFAMGFNPLTNTLYTLGREGILQVFLGPSGTEVAPPATPSGLSARPGDGEVLLSWGAVDDPTLMGYHVYRRDRVDAGFTRITNQPRPLLRLEEEGGEEDVQKEVTRPEPDMVLVPEGPFAMGQVGITMGGPEHTVFLDSFYIDRYEVTAGQYVDFLNSRGENADDQGNPLLANTYSVIHSDAQIRQIVDIFELTAPDLVNRPVVSVSWYGAEAYCEWMEGRLPTEAEWEMAARGTDGRSYPWGEGLDHSKANYNGVPGWPTDVGSYSEDVSPYGAYDMGGNVREWVSDWFSDDASYLFENPQYNPPGPESGHAKVVKGGSWVEDRYEPDKVGSAARNGNPLELRIEGWLVQTINYGQGFRCARDSDPYEAAVIGDEETVGGDLPAEDDPPGEDEDSEPAGDAGTPGLQETTFVDAGLVNQRTYTYRVTSIGRGFLESEPAEPVSAVPEGGGNFRLVVLRASAALAQEDSVSLPLGIEVVEGFEEEVIFTTAAPEGVEVVFEPAQVVPPWVVELRVRVARNAPLGRHELVIQGRGGERTQTATLVIEVTERVLRQSVLTLELDQESMPLDIPLQLRGRLFPGIRSWIDLEFKAVKGDTLVSLAVETDEEGEYRAEFLAPFTDRWTMTAAWEGNDDFMGTQSRSVGFSVTPNNTRITCTSDLADDADLGWLATLKGRIFPSPGMVGVTVHVRRPDKTEERIEGVLSGAEGFYGYDLRMDQAGLWEIWASWPGNNRLLGAVSPVVIVPVKTDVGRVILVAGGKDSVRDIFWPTANYLGNLAYTTFQRRRFSKEKIFYLNDRQEQDVSRDGFTEDVDTNATFAGVEAAWAWARERVNPDNPLYVYLVGRGHPDGLEVGEGEILSAVQLVQDLEALETETGARVTVMVEAAHAGNFVRELSRGGRHVIACTGPGLAYYQAQGYMSFSQYFLTDLRQGKSLQEAFLHTSSILRNLPGNFGQQRPGLEAEGNIITNQPGDYLATIDAFFGAPFELGDMAPQIRSSSLAAATGGVARKVVTQTLPVSEGGVGPRLKLAKLLAEKGVEISARIDDPEGTLKVVRAMVMPPQADPVSALTTYPEVVLQDQDGDGKWVGIYREFLVGGVYPVIIYAVDEAGNAAEPMRTTVLVEAEQEVRGPVFAGDFNRDNRVDLEDFFLFAGAYGTTDPRFDMNEDGRVDSRDFFLFAGVFQGPLAKLLTLAEQWLQLPRAYALAAPYPNPFNHEVVLKYALPEPAEVELLVYDALGQVVRRLVAGFEGAGFHRVVWDGRDEEGKLVATGAYIARLQAGEFAQMQKMTLVK